MKGAVKADHMPVNKYELIVIGLPPLTFTAIGGIEDELETVAMPDRTVRSGGNKGPVEFTADLPAHHLVQQAAMEAWFVEGQDPVSLNYLKVGTLVLKSNTGLVFRSYSFVELFVFKRGTPDLEMANAGDPAIITWTLKASDMLPL